MVVPEEAKKGLIPGRVAKRVAGGNGMTAVGYWGGTVQVFGRDGSVKLTIQVGDGGAA